ncbi:MAG: DUF3095 domain-containing protein [Ignavibacteriales bacterium]|nr:DUF3095 domain-containing protein [Ignavibacteriales bacterium]
MSNDSFYQDLTPIQDFADISDPSLYTEMPDDWYVAVSDIKNSTELIRNGRYKEVNLVGASTIIAILNHKKNFSIPFIFGGDGACICIPHSLIEQTKESLLGTKKMAMDLYGMELRVGIVPIRYIRERGYNVMVAPCRLSQSFAQAAFSGGGIQFAEECLKNPATTAQFSLESSGAAPAADFSGLECRWKNVPSIHGEIVTLIVQSLGTTDEQKNKTYRDIIRQIGIVYGDDAKCHPLQEQLLTMSLQEKDLLGESGIRSYSKGRLYRIFYRLKIRYGVLLGKFLMWSGYTTKNLNWGTYKKRLIENTDFKKFDDKLRQVLSGSAEQRGRLTGYLETKFRERELVYGIHTASSALITCLLFNYNDEHIHLVDSDDGGYAIAAIQVKEKLARI